MCNSSRLRARVLRSLARAPVRLFDWNLGWVLGHRFVMLEHVGRRTGARHRTVVEVVQWDASRRQVVVVSGFGPGADWYRNVTAAGSARVALARERFDAIARVIPPEQAATVLADYERRNRAIAPAVRWMLGRLVGWRYDGSPAARRRVVEQLPMVAFTPTP
jgi:deazaflavin-dependent oxidoreductase (nitroreductase family)